MAHLARRYTQDLAVAGHDGNRLADIDDEICSHALIDRSSGSRVRVISFTAQWPAAAVRRCLRHG
jgi:hypothetical protein